MDTLEKAINNRTKAASGRNLKKVINVTGMVVLPSLNCWL